METGAAIMGTGRVRRTLARLVGAAGAIAVAAVLIVFGPRAADLPAGLGDLPGWFTAAPEQGLVTIVAAVAWLCLLWLCLGVLLATAAAIPGGIGRLSAALARLVLPRAMRRLVEVGLGVTLVAGIGPVMTALPAMASPANRPRHLPTVSSQTPSLVAIAALPAP
ncbi:hypothetical protein ND747_20190, partial [Frankia sp. R82]|nr:hypothetical protein [Frankia sp. R82]